jgi:hypothetical protein
MITMRMTSEIHESFSVNDNETDNPAEIHMSYSVSRSFYTDEKYASNKRELEQPYEVTPNKTGFQL